MKSFLFNDYKRPKDNDMLHIFLIITKGGSRFSKESTFFIFFFSLFGVYGIWEDHPRQIIAIIFIRSHGALLGIKLLLVYIFQETITQKDYY